MTDLVQSKIFRDNRYHANRLTAENSVAVALWCRGVLVKEHDALEHSVTYEAINVPTVEGMKRAQEGDWIIERHGVFIVVKAHDFDQHFEAVVDG